MRFIDRPPRWLIHAAALLAAATAVSAHAADEGRFQVRNAYIENIAGVWQLNVRLDLSLSAAAAAALDEGVPLTLNLEAELHAERRFLPDAQVASQAWRWQLEFDAIAGRYVVSGRDGGSQSSFISLEEALQELARIRALPFAAEDLLQPGRRHEVGVRAAVEIGGMPDAVKVLLFWRDWSRTTDWYAWSVQP